MSGTQWLGRKPQSTIETISQLIIINEAVVVVEAPTQWNFPATTCSLDKWLGCSYFGILFGKDLSPVQIHLQTDIYEQCNEISSDVGVFLINQHSITERVLVYVEYD